MDLKKLDAELNIKIIESYKETLKDQEVSIIFDIPNNEVIEASTVKLNNNNFRLVKRLVIDEIDDLNPKYSKFIRKKIIKETSEMNHPQTINHIDKNTKYLEFFLLPFLGKKIIKTEVRSIIFRINYNNVIIELTKNQYDRLNYYTKYVYKLQQLHNLNEILDINQIFSVIFDDDKIAKDVYNSMYDNLKDIIKPRGNDNIDFGI